MLSEAARTTVIAHGTDLPPLPFDLSERYGDLYDAVSARVAEPKPMLVSPLPDWPEHDAWRNNTLDPWSAKHQEVLRSVVDAAPPAPSPGASPAEAMALARAAYLHVQLWATVALDEANVKSRIPPPAGELDPYSGASLEREMDRLEKWGDVCTDFGDGIPLPADLEPWKRHCQTLVKDVLVSLCGRSAAADLDRCVRVR